MENEKVPYEFEATTITQGIIDRTVSPIENQLKEGFRLTGAYVSTGLIKKKIELVKTFQIAASDESDTIEDKIDELDVIDKVISFNGGNTVNIKVFDVDNDNLNQLLEDEETLIEKGLFNIKSPLVRNDKKYWFVGRYVKINQGTPFVTFYVVDVASFFFIAPNLFKEDDIKEENLDNTDISKILETTSERIKVNFSVSDTAGEFTGIGGEALLTTPDRFTYFGSNDSSITTINPTAENDELGDNMDNPSEETVDKTNERSGIEECCVRFWTCSC